MTRLRRLWGLWWALLHKDNIVGLLIGGSVILGMVIIIAIVIIPIERSRVEGVVTGFGLRETDQGSYRVMTVQTPDGAYTVPTPARFDCRLGDRAVLGQTRHWWGKMAGLGITNRRPCTRPHSSR